MVDTLLIASKFFSKAASHIVVSLIAAMAVQLILPSARDWRIYLGTTLMAFVIGILAYMAGVDYGLGEFASHLLSALGGAFAYGVLAQASAINERIAKDKDFTKQLVNKLKGKVIGDEKSD